MFTSEIIGNLGSDAVVKDINGKKYVTMNVADSYVRKNAAGEKEKMTRWISVLWYGDGGNLLQYLKKGTTVYVHGRTSVNTFQRRDGSYDSGVSIDANEVQLCGSSRSETASAPSGSTIEDLPA